MKRDPGRTESFLMQSKLRGNGYAMIYVRISVAQWLRCRNATVE